MSGKKGRSGRPRSPRAKRISQHVRMEAHEEAALMAIVAHPRWAGVEGKEPTGPEVMRVLVRREAQALREWDEEHERAGLENKEE